MVVFQRLSLRRVTAVALLTLVAAPALAFPRGGGFAGGGFRAPAGGATFDRGGAGGFNGARPAWGDRTPSTLVRPVAPGGTIDRTRINTINNRPATLNRPATVNTFTNRGYNGWNTAWRNGGYWTSRPWNAGWYHWAPNTWGWWGGNAAAWGLAGLATGAVIGGLVNAAAANQSTVFVVPQTDYQLNYGSVDAVGTTGASFSYSVNGSQLSGAVDCQQGLLNGQMPANASQAQLINAVCQVAYGSGT